MYPVSEEFNKRVKQSHTAISRVDVYNGDTPLVENLEIERGYVHADNEAANRRRCDVVIADPNMTPEQASDLLHPLSGNELHIYRGIRLHSEHIGYKGLVLSRNPAAYWRLEDVSDSTGNGRTLTAQGSPTFGVQGAIVGDPNKAVDLDGGGTDWFSVPTAGLADTGNLITVEGWINPDAIPASASRAAIISELYGSGVDTNVRFNLGFQNSRIMAGFYDGAWHVAEDPSSIEVGRWYHYVGTYDGSTVRLYRNGVLVQSLAYSAALPTPGAGSEWRIGRRWDNLETIDGQLDEVAIYDYALTADEIKAHYDVGKDQHTKHTDELVPQGVFGIEDCNIDDQGESISISVKGFDRSKRVQRARWTDLHFVAEGTNVATAIRNILVDRYPNITIDWVDTEVTTETTPPLVYGYGGWSGGGDPWEHASKLAESIGYELYFGVEGKCKLTPVPDPATDPVVWTYQEGLDNLLLFGSRQLTREEVFNHVIAFGLNTATDTPIRVEAMDTNPNSPTYIDGPFGDVPTYYRSTLLLTETQAQAAAEALLREKLGTPEQVRFISVVHPAHQIGDVVQIERDRAGITGTHIIDKLAIPLGAMESMNATCRERRV